MPGILGISRSPLFGMQSRAKRVFEEEKRPIVSLTWLGSVDVEFLDGTADTLFCYSVIWISGFVLSEVRLDGSFDLVRFPEFLGRTADTLFYYSVIWISRFVLNEDRRLDQFR